MTYRLTQKQCCPPPRRNYMEDMRCLLTKIICTKPEPEFCNVSCPPLGCPRGPCPGMCRDECCRVNQCSMSHMPSCNRPNKCEPICRRPWPDTKACCRNDCCHPCN